MVKKIFMILLLFFSASAMSYAGDFHASVNRREISTSEPAELKLELSGAEPRGRPDLSRLSGIFQVVSEQQSSMTKIINGDASSSTIWSIGLIPLQNGAQTIPSISIETSGGKMMTKPISLSAFPPDRHSLPGGDPRGSIFTAHVTEREVYKGQTVLVNFKLIANRSIRNLQVGELSVKDAVVEKVGTPKVQNEIIDGRQRQVMVVSYRVTPMKDGELLIPGLLLKGEASAPLQPSKQATLHSFFDGGDPFAQMHLMMEEMEEDSGMMDPFAGVTPVTILSQPLTLNVLPAVPGMNPWLPAHYVRISGTWSTEKAKVGEPITGTILTEIGGVSANQIPNYEDQMQSNSHYKVYFDQPEISVKEGSSLESVRKDHVTLIPDQAGPLTLPSIKLTWWDTVSRSQKVAVLPEKTFEVSPGALTSGSVPSDLKPASAVKNEKSVPAAVGFSQVPIGLSILLVLAGCMFLIQKYRSHPLSESIDKMVVSGGITPINPVSRKDLEKCQSVKEMSQFLLRFAQQEWGIRPNCPLAEIITEAAKRHPSFGFKKAKAIQLKMERAIYAHQEQDLESLKREIAGLINVKNKNASRSSYLEYLPNLNPS